ncbi:MAG TPA: glycoside hydrolase family 2 TIM barrel-domain containing protein [Verrucomicrobiae bacterium]|jgi:beta-galactosidase|nr:glycoside hydrolase family 2 TIM barrel-domain containing protein [Verrucomicrobiae bacterium]
MPIVAKIESTLVSLLLVFFAATAFAATTSFDSDWRFLKGDAEGAELPQFNDTAWDPVNLPHDWSIAGPFDKDAPATGAGAFLPTGVGWYRKKFTLSEVNTNSRVFVEFDGVMANSDVWINGAHLGHRPSGSVSFIYDMTSSVHFGGEDNILSVRADTSMQPASRWYAGSGIYRHAQLIITDPVHIEHWSTFITTHGDVIRAQMIVTNQSSTARTVSVRLMISGVPTMSGSQTIPAGASAQFSVETSIENPRIWDIARPNLYHALITVREGNTSLDTESVSFGIREFHFDPATGFWLNGRNLKIKGVCLHEDGSCFGAAVPLGVWERCLHALRELGVNTIRTAHNPPSPEFLDLCDRMGFLVMDEFFDCWTVGKNRYDYHLYFKDWSNVDARDTIRRDRNHPSIILYSVGNEIHDTPKAALAKEILEGFVKVCHENDPTRPVTQALFRPNVSGDYTNGLADLLDVIGTNYRDNELLAAHHAKPSRKIIGTEQRHDRATWLECRDHPEHAGQFLWTGVDYLGESRRWPVIAAGSGLLDRCAEPKPMAFQRQSWWSDKPMVLITRRLSIDRSTPVDPGFAPLDRGQTLFSDWTPHDISPHDETVEAYSNCEEVELLLNGRSLGTKPLPADASPRVWTVPFEAGKIEAVAKNKGVAVARHTLQTAGPPASITLTQEQFENLAFVRATIVDSQGTRVPTAVNLIHFETGEPGAIIAVDSADNASHEPFQAQDRRAFEGDCYAIVKTEPLPTQIHLTASATGLKSASLEIGQ